MRSFFLSLSLKCSCWQVIVAWTKPPAKRVCRSCFLNARKERGGGLFVESGKTSESDRRYPQQRKNSRNISFEALRGSEIEKRRGRSRLRLFTISGLDFKIFRQKTSNLNQDLKWCKILKDLNRIYLNISLAEDWRERCV